MELSTILGIIFGIMIITVGLVLKGASLTALINPAAFVIIFIGTAACLLNGFSLKDLKKFPMLMQMLFKQQQLIGKAELLRLFVELSQTARREGILALESRMEEISDPFLRNGISMIVDGLDAEFVGDVLEADVRAMEERHQAGALIFTQAGTYAPTLGVLGAVVGLIAALGNLNDIDKLGQSIAAAFVATLLGIFTGYVLWHPFANKLKQMSKHEAQIKRMMIEGVLSLQAGDSPIAVEAKLLVFVPQKERADAKPGKPEA